jgi:O-antigen ligase
VSALPDSLPGRTAAGANDAVRGSAMFPAVPASPGARSRLAELGVGLLVIAVPLAFFPMSAGPFVEVKMVLVLGAAVAMWLGHLPIDRTVARIGIVWVLVMAIASVAGVDRWWSAFGPENLGTGMLLMATSVFLFLAGTGLPDGLVAKIPRWLLLSATGVAVVAIVNRFAPQLPETVMPRLSFEGSTLGNPVFVAGLAAAALSAAIAARIRLVWLVTALILISSALSLSTKRVGLVAVAIGLVVAIRRARPARRQGLPVFGVATGTLVAWILISPLVHTAAPFTSVGRFGELETDSSRARVVIAQTLLRASVERPLLGWGPGNTWSAYLSAANAHEVDLAKRGVGDAHDLPLQVLVTTGLLGLIPFLALCGVVISRMRRRQREMGWAVGALAALAVVHMLQPVNVALTPLMFLLAGVVARGDPSRDCSVHPGGRAIRGVVGASLCVGLVGSVLVLTASTLEQWGRSYSEEWALRSSLAIAPWRVSAVQGLALDRALDSRSRDPAAATEARDLIAGAIRQHPLNPALRISAMDVELIIGDPVRARVWLQEQVQLFPGDIASYPHSLRAFLDTGALPPGNSILQTPTPTADTPDT